MKKEESKREELNLTRLKQACKTMALFLVCCWIRRQPFWTSKHYVSFFGEGGGRGERICMRKELKYHQINNQNYSY